MDVKTYPDANAEIVGILRTGDSQVSQYAAARIEELEAIVAKLLVTKDGVSVVPGMKVYWPNTTIEVTILAVWWDGKIDCESDTNRWARIPWDGFASSTRQAAENAEQEGKSE